MWCRRRELVLTTGEGTEAISVFQAREFARSCTSLRNWEGVVRKVIWQRLRKPLTYLRWSRFYDYAVRRKRMNVLASAVGELLQTFARRRRGDMPQQLQRRRCLPACSQPFPSSRWMRFLKHVLKVHYLGHLAGALLSHCQTLNARRRGVLQQKTCLMSKKEKRKVCTCARTVKQQLALKANN